MFNLLAESSDSSPDCCDDGCSCCGDEAYLDQVAARNYEDASKDKLNKADHGELRRYNMPCIKVPLKMRADSEAVPTSGDEQAETEKNCPFPPTLVETTVTDPIVVTSLGSDTTITASAEAIAIFKQHKKNKRLSKASPQAEKPVLQELQSYDAVTPRTRPPPPTPREYATLPHTLSTPNLPVFHHYTDDGLLQKYELQRAEDPMSFDLQTSKIKQHLSKAKIERGGVGHLEESEYSVDLASREDARKVQQMAIQRHRGMTETSMNDRDTILSSAKNLPEHMEVLTPQPTKKETPISNSHHRCKSRHNLKNSASELPENFNFARHVAKNITSGSIRHQHSRKVIVDDTGTKTTLKTWIEITQTINVPSADQLTWEDVKTANQDAEAARKEMKTKIQANKEANNESSENHSDADSDKANADLQLATETDTEAEELLGALARIHGTGLVTRGVSLSQYLTETIKDIKHPSKEKGTTTNEADFDDESE